MAAAAHAAGANPPAPDYASAGAWAAWPGRASGADAIAPGLEHDALPDDSKADVFFIHPTTYLSGAAANARYDEPGGTTSRIDSGVLRFQASAFNACCRIFAPHYRQAALGAFTRKDSAAAAAAYELAYQDVLSAFAYYLAHENHGRPFIIASHSQGSLHAARLLQERIAGRPLQRQLVAAYVIGYYVPADIERTGLPLCRSATQTGCLIDWNTLSDSSSDAQRENTRLVWFEGRYQPLAARKLVCVNPLNWGVDAAAAADLNLGALPGVRPGAALEAPVPHLTGARCDGGALRVSIPLGKRHGFTDLLTLFGSYHIFDYNLFYANIRGNAKARVLAFRSSGG
ncbi:MAG TPA: DUF3089 domain-containing protein [Candidatus Dormibacteraeota bacterium]|nr:DUF3089 domain-containing protein [Candidatus Dormibacteraeota bacterium]